MNLQKIKKLLVNCILCQSKDCIEISRCNPHYCTENHFTIECGCMKEKCPCDKRYKLFKNSPYFVCDNSLRNLIKEWNRVNSERNF